MYYLLEIETKTSLSPDQLDPKKDANELLLKALRETLEGQVLTDVGLVVAVISCNIRGEGRIPPRSPEIYFRTNIRLIAFKPIPNEVVEGEIVNVTETGAFVNLGSLDGFWPRNRISNRRMEFNARKGTLEDREEEIVIRRKEKARIKVNNVEVRTPNTLSSLLKETRSLVSASGIKNPIRIQLEGRGEGIGLIKKLHKERKEILQEIGVT